MLQMLFLWAVLLLLAALWYSGVFSSVSVRVGAASLQGSLSIRYKFGTGPYWTVGSVFRELQAMLPSSACLVGIFYDDPKTTPSSECRWAVGVVTRATNRKPLAEIFTEKLASAGFSAWEVPAIERAVVSGHPCTSLISVYVAPWKVYPAITKFIQSERLTAYPAVELYENGHIEYCMPLEQQQAYYVHEAQ